MNNILVAANDSTTFLNNGRKDAQVTTTTICLNSTVTQAICKIKSTDTMIAQTVTRTVVDKYDNIKTCKL